MPRISALDTITTPDDADQIPLNDVSVPQTKKITLAGLLTWLQTKLGWITPAMISNPYRFSAYCSVGKNITNNTLLVDLQTELYDSNNNFANSRYTAPVSGYYQLNGQCAVGSAGMGTNEWATLNIRKNGVTVLESDRMNGSGDANRLCRSSINTSMYLAAGDYVELWLSFQGNRDMVPGQSYTWFNGHLQSQA